LLYKEVQSEIDATKIIFGRAVSKHIIYTHLLAFIIFLLFFL